MAEAEKKKILIVDDEEALREVLTSILEQEGYSVIQAADGRQGVESAKKNRPDLILMDVMMPHMTGFQALEKLKKMKETVDIPVIMVTAKADDDSVGQGMQLYADKYISKPYDMKHLLLEVKKTLALRA